MNLYHWNHCEVLRNYACGNISVIATSEADARDKVRAAYLDYLKQEREFLFWEYQDEDDREEIKNLQTLLEKDLTQTPEIRNVIFNRGSE